MTGLDFLMVDNQHGTWTHQDTMLAFRSICLGTATPMVRVEQNDFFAIGTVLDRGALGVLVPMVNSREEAEAAAYAMRYAPRGGRSYGPFGAAFHADGSYPDYEASIDDEVFLAVQIETQKAVENIDEILAVDGVDCGLVGPNDLRLTMGVEAWSKEHEQAIQSVVEACQRAGKIAGIAAWGEGKNSPWRRVEQGFLFVAATNDRSLLTAGAKALLQKMGRSS
jgi:2-keto-3-deoxy-L-rhamnonate aldolase RhmA